MSYTGLLIAFHVVFSFTEVLLLISLALSKLSAADICPTGFGRKGRVAVQRGCRANPLYHAVPGVLRKGTDALWDNYALMNTWVKFYLIYLGRIILFFLKSSYALLAIFLSILCLVFIEVFSVFFFFTFYFQVECSGNIKQLLTFIY